MESVKKGRTNCTIPLDGKITQPLLLKLKKLIKKFKLSKQIKILNKYFNQDLMKLQIN